MQLMQLMQVSLMKLVQANDYLLLAHKN